MKKILVLMADGFEEVEALAPIDILRRAEMQVDVASISEELTVTGARKARLVADILLKDTDVSMYDACILPGGYPGYENLAKSAAVKDAVVRMHSEGKLIAAICAAPTVVAGFGILDGKKACCYPGMEGELGGAIPSMDKVVVEGNIITSRGAGTAIDFSLAILEYFTDAKTSEEMAKTIVYA